MKTYHKIKIWLAIKIEWLRPYLLNKKEQEKIIIVEFRLLALLFGFDTSNMSDSEIKQNATQVAKEISKSGLSASEVGEALRRIVLSYPKTGYFTIPKHHTARFAKPVIALPCNNNNTHITINLKNENKSPAKTQS